MGTDIHCYVEYRSTRKSREEAWGAYDAELRREFPDGRGMGEFRDDPEPHWRSFGGRINPGRNYRVFGRLAGLRWREVPLVAPIRGYPEDAGYWANDDYWSYVDYNREPGDEGDEDRESISPETAKKYISYGCATRGVWKPQTWTQTTYDENRTATVTTKTIGADYDGQPTHVAGPDWHTPSWVTPDEWQAALSNEDSREVEYFAVLASLREFQRRGFEARVVFWFDN